MANITVAPGGGIVANGVPVYLPSCAVVGYADVNRADADRYDITSSDYLQKLVPTVVPGIVLGLLCTLGFLFFALWCCVQCCNRRKVKAAGSERAQFLAAGAPQSSPYDPAPPPASWRQRRWAQPGFLYKALLVALALALAGTAAWGLAESVEATDTTFSHLWANVNDVERRVYNATRTLLELEQHTGGMAGNLSVVAEDTAGMLEVLASARIPISVILPDPGAAAAVEALENVTTDAISVVTTALYAAPAELDALSASISAAGDTLRDNLMKTIEDVKGGWESPTMAFEQTWRFIPIAVMFGLTLALALAAGPLFWRLRFYKTATLLTTLLWLDIALLMFLGVGLLQGVYVVSTDSCMYAEDLALRLALTRVDPSQQQSVLTAFKYYLGLEAIEDAYVASNVTGVPTYLLHAFAQGPVLNYTTDVLLAIDAVKTEVQEAAPLDYPEFLQNLTEALGAASNLTTSIGPLSASLWNLESQALRSSVDPLYRSLKEYICCDLSTNSSSIFTAWTVVGSLGLVLAVLCSARLVNDMLTMRRQRRRMVAAAAAAAAGGGAALEAHEHGPSSCDGEAGKGGACPPADGEWQTVPLPDSGAGGGIGAGVPFGIELTPGFAPAPFAPEQPAPAFEQAAAAAPEQAAAAAPSGPRGLPASLARFLSRGQPAAAPAAPSE